MEDIISDDEIVEAAVNMDDYLLGLIDQGFGVSAINGIVLARLMMLNRETENETDFFNFIATLKQENQIVSRTLQ